MNYHFRNLVFEGGGIKGIAYLGALEVLEQKGVLQNIVRVGGTSAGAITALLLALNYSLSEIKEIIWNMDFHRFMDSTWGLIRNTDRLLKEYGWYKGDYFKRWAGNLIKQKTGSVNTTFEELSKLGFARDLYLIGTNLSTGFATIYSAIHTPKVTIVDAIRVSMSIPIFFTAVRNSKNDVCVDGGVLENYPIKLFDRQSFIENFSKETEYYDKANLRDINGQNKYVFNMETLGFRLDSNYEIKLFERQEPPESHPINNFYEFIKRLISTMLDGQQNRHLHSDDWQRTIYIDSLGVRTTDFGVSEALKNALVISGRNSTEKYLAWFERSKGNVANRPRDYYSIID